MIPDTTRQYPRTLRDAFPSDYRESCLGVERPIQTAPTRWEQFMRLARGVARFLMQRKVFK